MNISHLARPILARLCRTTNETVNLGLPDLLDLMVVDSFQGSRILHATASAGWRSLYHCTALGKAIMAGWDEPMRSTIYSAGSLSQQTPHTITDVDVLEEQLAGFREQGYAVDQEENELGVSGVSTWIVNGLGEVTAAISVAGPSNRLTQEVMQQIASEVIIAAKAITEAMRGVETPENPGSRRRR